MLRPKPPKACELEVRHIDWIHDSEKTNRTLPMMRSRKVGRGLEPLLMRSLTGITAGARVTAPPPHRNLSSTVSCNYALRMISCPGKAGGPPAQQVRPWAPTMRSKLITAIRSVRRARPNVFGCFIDGSSHHCHMGFPVQLVPRVRNPNHGRGAGWLGLHGVPIPG